MTSTARTIPIAVLFAACLLIACGLGCHRSSRTPQTFVNPGIQPRFEEEFKSRELDPIEGFWQAKTEYGEGIGVCYRTDPSANMGFPYAVKSIRETRYQELPWPFIGNRVGARYKRGAPGVYHGQILMFREGKLFWEDATLRLLSPTTVEVTMHAQGPVLGGNTQRGHLIGPQHVLDARLAAENRYADGGPRTRSGSGSGFLVGRSIVATAAHVVEDAKSIRCHINDSPASAKVVAHDESADLALLKLDSPAPSSMQGLPLGSSAGIRLGQRVFAFGYPLTYILGQDLRAHEGIVSSLTGFEGRSLEFQVEMSINPGNSGGPVIDNRGQVIGVVTSKLGLGVVRDTGNIPEGIAFAIKADLLRTMAAAAGVLDEFAATPAAKSPRSSEQIAEYAREFVVRIEVE